VSRVTGAARARSMIGPRTSVARHPSRAALQAWAVSCGRRGQRGARARVRVRRGHGSTRRGASRRPAHGGPCGRRRSGGRRSAHRAHRHRRYRSGDSASRGGPRPGRRPRCGCFRRCAPEDVRQARAAGPTPAQADVHAAESELEVGQRRSAAVRGAPRLEMPDSRKQRDDAATRREVARRGSTRRGSAARREVRRWRASGPARGAEEIAARSRPGGGRRRADRVLQKKTVPTPR
jgi:hypothetical protein